MSRTKRGRKWGKDARESWAWPKRNASKARRQRERAALDAAKADPEAAEDLHIEEGRRTLEYDLT